MSSHIAEATTHTVIQISPAAAASPEGSDDVLVALITSGFSLLAAAAWPILILAIALIFRDPVTKLIGRITRIKHGDTEVGLDEQFQELLTPANEEQIPDLVQPIELQRRTPIDAVVTSWVSVERAIEHLYGNFPIASSSTTNRPYSTIRATRTLANAGAISHSTLMQIDELRRLRNLVVHHPEESLSEDSVQLYVANAAAVVREIEASVTEPVQPPPAS